MTFGRSVAICPKSRISNHSDYNFSHYIYFSAGIIAYEVITRHEAFSGSGVAQDLIICLICSKALKPEEKYVDDVEELLEERETDLSIFRTIKGIMVKCWDHSPEKRPSASEGK